MSEERTQPAPGQADSGPAGGGAVQRDPELFAAQVHLVRRNMPVSFVGLVANGLVLAYVLWPIEPREPLLLWLGTLVGVTLLRTLQFRTARASVEHLPAWTQAFVATTALSGLVWGAVGLVVTNVSPIQQVFIAFLTGGLAAGAVGAYCAVAWLPHAFIVPATSLVALGLLWRGGELSVVMAAMVALFGVLMSIMARSLHGTILSALRLRTENRALVSFLTEAKNSAERLNDELKQEIAEREQAELALRESEERFRSLVESATDGIGFTFEGRIYYANQAALDIIGYPAEEVLGLPIERFLGRTTLPTDQIYQRYVDRMAGQEVPRQYETQMVRKDGTVVDVMFSNSLVSLDGRQGVMSLVKDITERKKAEEELRAAKETAEEATRLKDQFVSLLAHDLRAPLNSMISMVALMRSDAEHPLPEEHQRILRRMSEQGESTVRMIDDLLHVSRLHTGKLKPEWRFVDASAVVATAVSLLRPLAEDKRIALEVTLPPHTRLYTDVEMFAKVLYNLLSNAIKFSPRGGRIRVAVPPGRPTTLAVQDHGAGIDAQLLPDLFRHEVKTSTTGTAGERGTGLGLPLSQELMHALGGEITLETAPDQGSTFFATLPAVRPKVLVVGKDESLTLFVRPQLESIDAEFLAAADGEDAVRMLGDGVHLVIAEARLRGNGGLNLLQHIRGNPAGRTVPLLLVADAAEANLMEDGFRLGADDIVFKPLQPNDFLVRLRRFIT